jgi:phosphoribosyl-AMP cyclohydrolase / phosphoribosyl-ATP pyrophosphohydrolase
MENIDKQNLQLDFKKYEEGMMPVIVQDEKTGQIMMLGFANEEAYEETLKTQKATFWSRSRNELWTKGITSGDTLSVKRIFTDCDTDTLIYEVSVDGAGACHIPEFWSCFEREIDLNNGRIGSLLIPTIEWSRVLNEEELMIEGRKTADPEKSGTAKVLQQNISRIAQKFGEEAIEVVCALTDPEQGKERVISEVADLMYRLQIALVKAEVSWSDVEDEVVKRRK